MHPTHLVVLLFINSIRGHTKLPLWDPCICCDQTVPERGDCNNYNFVCFV